MFGFLYAVVCWFGCLLQVVEQPTVITHKKRTLHLQMVNRQVKIRAENLLIIKHGSRRVNLTALERIGYSKFNKLLEVRAFTVTPKGDTLHVTHFNDQSAVQAGIFYDDYMERTFFFPGVVPGAVSHLYYTEELSEPRFLGAYYFGSSLPVLDSRFEIICDRNIHLRFSAFNAEQVKFRQKKVYRGRRYSWHAVNVPVFHKKNGERDISYRAPHIIPRIAYCQLPHRTKLPLLEGIADLYAWYGGLVTGVTEENGNNILQHFADSLTAGLHSPLAKAQAIFHWVQQNIQYIAFEDGYGGLIPRKAADILRKRYGDCKDMTALLVALMRRAGIEAYFTWIGTRRLPYRYTELPTPMVDNHMIATVQIGDNIFFLDATDADLPFGMPSAMIQGKEALIGKSPQAYEIRTVPVTDAACNILYDSAMLNLRTDTITASGLISGSGYFKGALNNKQPLFTERGLTNEQWKVQQPVSDSVKYIHYAYRWHHALVKEGERLFFNPHTVVNKYSEQWLPPATPFTHWELEYAFTLIQKLWIPLPAGWQALHVPDDVSVRFADFGFDIRYEKKAEGINIIRTIFVNSLSVPAHRASDWRQLTEKYGFAVRQNIIFQPDN